MKFQKNGKIRHFSDKQNVCKDFCNKVIFLKNHCSVLLYIQNIFWYGPKMTVYVTHLEKKIGPAQNSFGPIEAQDTRQRNVVLPKETGSL